LNSLESYFGPNTALVEELYSQYQENPESVPNHWRKYFDELSASGELDEEPQEEKKAKEETRKKTSEPEKKSAEKEKKADTKKEQEQDKKKEESAESSAYSYEKIKGVASRVVTNMEESLDVPTATSLRVVPVKMLIEDRKIINDYMMKRGDKKVTFTNFISWAVIQSLKEFPNLANALAYKDDKAHKAIPNQINLGIAIDLPARDGSRKLVVPNIKGVDKMNFQEFLKAYHDLINRARNGKLDLADFENTTISITNPGTLGTVSSIPRLMKNQGAIIATGAMDYPAEYQSMAQEVLNHLGISKVMTATCTYDHRIIQGAESGSFLGKVHKLLNGEEEFYKRIFQDLDIPYDPVPFGIDNYTGFIDGRGQDVNHKAISVMQLINMYRTRGHLLADLNPLKHGPGHYPELEFPYYGLTIWDLDREFYCGGLGGYEKAPLRVIVKLLRDTYCGFIGAEYMHILELEERRWLRERMESTANYPNLSIEEKKQILHKLNQAMAFEQFLHRKYIGHKRFSLEGAETLIPMIDFMLEKGSELDIENVVIGMAHRGRLNVLVNTIGKSYDKIFAEFAGNIDPNTFQGSGDVKYHLGTEGVHNTNTGREIKLKLLSNPSHLEAVNPVVEGTSRALQDLSDAKDPKRNTLPLLIHGDAAFAGQGVVAETLNMSQLEGFTAGGTIHVIINNQIGFTTLPEDGRSTQYASDLGKMIMAPIFHINGDEPEAAVHSIRLALEYRQKFHKDVILDLVCYRKYGHNEGDEPAFTQPGLYKEINNHPSVRDIYTEELVKKKELNKEEAESIFDEFNELLEGAFEQAKKAPSIEDHNKLIERDQKDQKDWDNAQDTTFPLDDLKHVAKQILTVPKDFDANPKLLRILAKRNEIVEKNQKKIDWGFSEALSFGSVLTQNIHIRLTGQDVERGTFSQRHSVLHGTETNQEFIPLNNIQDDQSKYEVFNSFLSEFGVLGFEFGYSSTDPNSLVIWEAQFGDFVNGGQIIIDQFISSAEAKWGQKTNLVMLLPHGFEGQGPEHSSGRMERFLQLCAEDNLQVANCSTPAQYFHILRRQALQEKKKPLIMFTPKSLLRHPKAVSNAEELANGKFNEVLPDTEITADDNPERLVLCSGKVYYDLLKYRDENDITDVSIARLEQYYPFPDEDIKDLLEEFSDVKDIVWCQEEPKNMGSWSFLWPRLLKQLGEGQDISYAGRRASASPATGSAKLHQMEQEELVKKALVV
jgi:2-oxoglutarate dehydrogenase E1 component